MPEKISYHTIRYLRGHRGDRELRPFNFNSIINDTVDLMPLSENVELKNNNLRTPKPENID